MIRINDIIERLLGYKLKPKVELIQKAYIWSARLHKDQRRLSGRPYLSHPLEVAGILTELQADEPTIAAGLLHDTIEDCAVTKPELEREFGDEISNLVDGVTRVGKISRGNKPELQAEYLGKMILAMARDIRVVLIKLADRLHNMQTLNFHPEQKQVEIAEETLEIYAPIAHRLGIYWIKTELEDLSFRYLKPEIYYRLVEEVAKIAHQRQDYLKRVQSILKEKLKAAGLEAEVEGRIKHYYSIYQKLEQQKLSLEEMNDLYGFRILTKTIRECYEALYVIHSFWVPVPGRIKDYIALPKTNLYQSLHTSVIGPEGERIEIQIRTYEMHKIAEEGIAAHWLYKKGVSVIEEDEEDHFAWLKRLVEFKQELSDPHQFLETVKSDLFPDEVYVFTPKSDLNVFPKGATPIDFAFSVHTDLGVHCAGARVNNRIVPLSYKLKSGDIVEIISSKETHPVKAWLEISFTQRARTKIQHYLRSEETKKSSELGRQIIETELLKFDLHLNNLIKSGKLDELARKFSFADHKKLLEAIGYGKFSHRKIVAQLVSRDELRRMAPGVGRKGGRKAGADKKPRGILIKSVNEPLIQFGPCCQPLPGEEIVVYLTPDSGYAVHKAGCPKIQGLDPDKIIPAGWSKKIKGTFTTTIEVVSSDETGLLSEMSGAISKLGINISKALVRTIDGQKAVATFEIQLNNASELSRVLNRLGRIRKVISVEKISGAS